MAANSIPRAFCKNVLLRSHSNALLTRNVSTTAVCHKSSVGRYKPVEGRYQLLTLDQALKPHEIAHKKSWNSWNTSVIAGGKRSQLTTIEDMFIRRFIRGAWFCLVLGGQIIIKRQHNMIRIAFCVTKLNPQTAYFITGFCEEMLSIWLHCPVKLEVQIVERYEGFVKVV